MTFSLKWPALSKFGENKIIKTSGFWLFFVPIAARVLQSVPETVSITLGSHSFDIHPTLPFSWIVLFLASTFFAVGEFIYQQFCPAIIRDFKSLEQFKKEGRTGIQVLWLLREACHNEKYNHQRTEANVEHVCHEFGDPKNGVSTQGNIASAPIFGRPYGPDAMSNSFYMVRDMVSEFKPRWRLACTLQFYAGFICTAVIVIQNGRFVSGAMWRWFHQWMASN